MAQEKNLQVPSSTDNFICARPGAPRRARSLYFPKAGIHQNIEEFLTAKANKANKDT
jgi:hypothetical protein